MYPPKFDYYRADSVDEAVTLLQHHAGAKLLAGGHSLLPVMKLRLADPGVLIDIGRIKALKGISVDHGRVRIGALTSHAAVAASDHVPAALSQAAGMIGDPMVRNRGTIGGNLAHADPASDLPTVLVALGAAIHITGSGSSVGGMKVRSVAAADFFTGLFETALGEHELLTSVEMPIEVAGTGSAYAKFFNPASRYAVVGAAAVVTVAKGVCSSASIAVGGLTPCATLAPSVAAALVGKELTVDAIRVAAAAVNNDLDADDIIGDVFASAGYRQDILPSFVASALMQAVERAG